jgi:hypothetical protein
MPYAGISAVFYKEDASMNITGERLSFAAPLPADLAALISEENIL